MSDRVRPHDNARSSGAEGSDLGATLEPGGVIGSSRQRIVDTASLLFCSRGYERTPLRAISESLGVTKAAVYYYFKAKDDLLVAIVAPLLDRIDAVIESAGPTVLSVARRRQFLAAYISELINDVGVVSLLLRDPAVSEQGVGQRFAHQHLQMRGLLGAVDEPGSVIRTTTALRALELAVVDFGDTDPVELADTALSIGVAVLDSDRAARRPS